jgi:hypothetical protein
MVWTSSRFSIFTRKPPFLTPRKNSENVMEEKGRSRKDNVIIGALSVNDVWKSVLRKYPYQTC